jgi:hypothetical protein
MTNAEDFGDFTAGSDGTCALDAGVVTTAKCDTAVQATLAKADSALQSASIFGGITIAATTVSATQATVTVTCKDISGATLAAKKAIQFWFTTAAIQTVPSIAGIESWTYVAHGNVEAYWDLARDGGVAPNTNVIYIATTHTDGTMDFDIRTVGAQTNYICVLGPLGSYSNLAVICK